MPEIHVDVVVTGDRAASALLNRLATRLDDGRPQLLGLVDQLLANEQRRFRNRGAGGSGAWKRLAPSTLRLHRHLLRSDEPLILTGTLMRSLTIHGAPGQIVEVHPGLLRFGTRVFYAKFHQQGHGVPKRTIVGATRAERKDLSARLKRLLVEDL